MTNRTKACVCKVCLKTFEKEMKGRINSNYCSEHYPLYRKAYLLYLAAKARSKKQKLEFDIDPEFVLGGLLSGCPKTGFPFDFSPTNNYRDRNPLTPSLDKISPKGGYTKDNVQIVCWAYNLIKASWSDLFVENFCDRVSEITHNKRRPYGEMCRKASLS